MKTEKKKNVLDADQIKTKKESAQKTSLKEKIKTVEEAPAPGQEAAP